MDNFKKKIISIYKENNSSALFTVAAEYEIQQGNNVKAVEILNSGLQYFPEHPTAHILLGKAYLKLSDFEKAEMEFTTGSNIIDSKETLNYYISQIEILKRNDKIDVDKVFSKKDDILNEKIEENDVENFKQEILDDKINELDSTEEIKQDKVNETPVETDSTDTNVINNDAEKDEDEPEIFQPRVQQKRFDENEIEEAKIIDPSTINQEGEIQDENTEQEFIDDSFDERLDDIAKELSSAKLKFEEEEEEEEDPSTIKDKFIQTPKDAGIVTETLAKIYISQGKFKEALEVYEKLVIKMPRQKEYFLKKIKDIKEQLGGMDW